MEVKNVVVVVVVVAVAVAVVALEVGPNCSQKITKRVGPALIMHARCRSPFCLW